MYRTTSEVVTASPFDVFKSVAENGHEGYAAGYPSYPANFSRDTIIAGIIAGNSHLLASQLEISAQYQGKNDDPMTGEQMGRIHHEMPGAMLEGRNGYTTYNACDTTALFLIGAEGLSYADEEAYFAFSMKRDENLRFAAGHVLSAIGTDDGLFWEKPPKNGENFSLRVTYWKDSILPHSDGKLEPVYPVTFALSHFMAARGILSAGRLLGDKRLEEKADMMFRAGIQAFITPDNFTVYKDKEGELCQPSSDELHALAYIPAEYRGLLPLPALRQRASILTTPYGYMCSPSTVARHLSDKYHGDKIWVFEQAKIHYGATKFGLYPEAATAAAISDYIGDGQELFGLSTDGSLQPEGNDRQLWSVAASEYFAGNSLLSDKPWL